MNKKLFALLAATFLLASCGGGNSSSSSSGSTSGGKPGVNYGTLEAPLSVAQFQEEVKKDIEDIEASFSAAQFYVKGINHTSIKYGNIKDFGDGYTGMHLFDGEKVGDEEGLPVFKCVRGQGITAESIFDGDEVVIHAYGEYYDGRYTLYPNSETEKDCEMVSYKVGKSKITFNSPEHCTVTGIADEYENGTNAEITVTPETGYVVRNVFYKNVPVAATAGKYVLPVDGNAECNIVVVSSTAVEEDLPSGTYKLEVTMANCGLSGTASSSALDINYYVKEESVEHIYKPLVFKWVASAGYIQAQYNEFTLKKGKQMSICAPNGVISEVVNDYYSSATAKVLVGIGTEGAELEGVTGEKEGTHVPVTYTPNCQNITYSVGSGASYTQSWYSLKVTVTVA